MCESIIPLKGSEMYQKITILKSTICGEYDEYQIKNELEEIVKDKNDCICQSCTIKIKGEYTIFSKDLKQLKTEKYFDNNTHTRSRVSSDTHLFKYAELKSEKPELCKIFEEKRNEIIKSCLQN